MNDPEKAGHWPKIIIGIVLLFLLMTGWSIYRAATGVSAVVPGYYSENPRS